MSKDVLQIGQGSLYPALYRLEYKAWVRSEWRTSENNRRAKFYRLTQKGKKQLETELASWDRLSSAIASVLGRVRQEDATSYCRMSREAMPQSTDLLQGTLDLLILRSLPYQCCSRW
jgi:transcriptional regulator